MPQDWNDTAGWERYFRNLISSYDSNQPDSDTGSISIGRLSAFVDDLKSQQVRSVWIPGCGLSPMGWLLGQLGLEVIATDITRAAVEFQSQGARHFRRLKDSFGVADVAGSFETQVQDFRQPFRSDAFDLIINVKAIQGFTASDLGSIVRTHASALRPGRYAYFDTMNVQGERRDALEEALEQGGFIVPFASVNRWYRRQLALTGIPHVFILGNPMIPRTGVYSKGGPKWEQDMGQLQEVTARYRERLEEERELERARVERGAKVAHIIYSTG